MGQSDSMTMDGTLAVASAPAAGTLYADVAARVTGMIDGGTFGPGDRLPSVRALHAQLGVSITTVLEAYRLLEDRGVIVARPQSGYFVRSRPPAGAAARPNGRAPRGGQLRTVHPAAVCRAPEPAISAPSPEPSEVDTAEVLRTLLRHHHRPNLVELGMALPHPSLMPAVKLNRVMASIGRRAPHRAIEYDMPPGCLPLRVQLARRALAAGCALTPDQIVTTFGAQEAITLCLRAICEPGDTVALESPIYFGVWQALCALKLKAVEVPTDPRTGMCLDALAAALDQQPVKAVIAIPSFSNPLGHCMPDRKRKALVELLTARDVPLIEDDIYGDLAWGAERPRACKSFDTAGIVLLCSSFTKTLAPGYRVGWVAPGRYQARVEHLKFASSLATATLPQLTIAEFLADGGYDRYLRKIRRTFARHAGCMRQAVEAHFPSGTKVTRPTGGFVLWVEMPEAVDSVELYERALRANITLAPGPMFSAQPKYRNFVRLNAAVWSSEVEAAVKTVGRLAGEMCG